MSEAKYGVIIGRVKRLEADPAEEKTPHYMVIVEVNEQEEYRVAINCKSNSKDKSQVMYHINDNIETEICRYLKKMGMGFSEIDYHRNINANIAVDYIRRELINPEDMKVVPYDIDGEKDLKGYLDYYLKGAVQNDQIIVYAFGTYYEDSTGKGLHNIHMNQGNRDKHFDENQIYRDGCLFIHNMQEDRWTACFLAFQSQSWHTGEKGNPGD
ncbi:MAG: DUF2278 family protein [Halanaerobiales bacterium]